MFEYAMSCPPRIQIQIQIQIQVQVQTMFTDEPPSYGK